MMKYSINYIRPVFIVVVVCILVLFALQVQWLNSAYDTNRTLFTQKMDAAVTKAGDAYITDSFLPDLIHHLIIDENSNKSEIDRQLQKIIDQALFEVNVPQDYRYGLYKHGQNRNNVLVYGNSGINELEIKDCETDDFREFGWTSLTCSRGFGSENAYHLAIFPSYNTYLLNSVIYPIGLSIAAILLLSFGLYYFFKTIQTQKKISDIKNDFLNNLTHEFKTPIFSISLASRSLRKSLGEKLSASEQTYLDAIDQEGNRLKNQVDRVLQLSLLENKQIQWSADMVDIHHQIKEVIDGFRLILNERNGKVRLNFNADNHTIMADDLHLKNVWANLLDNAIKYSKEIVDICISTSNTDQGDIHISIEDKGIGFSKDQHDLLFDKFYRVSTGNIHATKGFGVGLAYVKGIINHLKGKINVSSIQNQGSTFEVIIPLND